MTLTYGSLCSGVEAATVAWTPLGFRPLWYSEIGAFPCRVLAYRHPDVPNLGDMTARTFIERAAEMERPDIIVGGTPCQSFSVGGYQRSLDDDRGNLALEYIRICDALEPRVTLWENVPGVLSTHDNAFGCFLGGLVGSPFPVTGPQGDSPYWTRLARSRATVPRWPRAGVCCGPARTAAWRILDAQYFGVPQMRRRVFVVASPRTSGISPEDVLFETLPVPEGAAPDRANSEATAEGNYRGVATAGARDKGEPIVATTPLRRMGPNAGSVKRSGEIMYTIAAHAQNGILSRVGARHLMPVETERLQGFPDGYTAIPGATDTNRYIAMGNSMAVPVMRWLGERIAYAAAAAEQSGATA